MVPSASTYLESVVCLGQRSVISDREEEMDKKHGEESKGDAEDDDLNGHGVGEGG